MAELNVKMGVSGVSQFIQSMNSAGASVKTIDAALKQNEKQLKATGDATTYMEQKSQLLHGKLKEQKRAIDEAQKALKALKENGADEAGKAFQDMQRKLLEAQSAMMDTEQQITELGQASVEASGETNQLVASLGGLNKKVSLDQVISGIKSITSGMETAAKKAAQLGESIWTNVMNSAKWADDTATMALMYGIDIDTFQRMQKLVTNGMDTSVDAILTAQSKLNRGIGNGNTNVLEFLKELKIGLREGNLEDPFSWKTKDPAKMFWEVGEALMNMSDAYDKEAAAQALFGRSWRELIPLFTEYKSLDEYNAALAEVNVNSEEDVQALAELNDKVAELKGNFATLSNEVWATMAPALTSAAEALNGLLTSILEYLDTPEGKQALADMSTAVSGLFDDLGKIDPEEVVNNFATLFNGVVDSFKWLKDNWQSVKDALVGIAIGFGALKIATLALNIGKVISGLGGLLGGGGSGGNSVPVDLQNVQPKSGVQNAVNPGAKTSVVDQFLQSGVGVGLTKVVSNAAAGLTMFDPTGLTALVPQVLADQTEFGRQLAMGNSLSAAFIASKNTFVASAEQGIKNFTQYFTQDAPNAFWRVLGFKDAKDAAETATEVLDKTSKNLQAAGEWTYGDDLTAEEAMALVSGKNGHSGRIYFGSVDGFEMGEDVDISTFLDAEDGAKEIQEQVGTVEIPVKLSVSGIGGGFFGGTNGKLWESFFDMFNLTGHANGLPFVPFDGYAAVLHRGERVLTASENRSYTYYNNTYFGGVNLNNGQDIDALCDSIDRHNRRQQSGFGE